MSTVEYRTIERFAGYRFGSDGSVWSSKMTSQWKPLKPRWAGGYLCVYLSQPGRRGNVAIHLAVAEAFLGPKPSATLDCCHNNGNRADCSIANLRYDSKKSNCADKAVHGTLYNGERHHDAKLTAEKVRSIRSMYGSRSLASIGSEFGVSARNVLSICQRKTWKHI